MFLTSAARSKRTGNQDYQQVRSRIFVPSIALADVCASTSVTLMSRFILNLYRTASHKVSNDTSLPRTTRVELTTGVLQSASLTETGVD